MAEPALGQGAVAMNAYNLVIPMAGMGTRFLAEGYTTPKPLLPVGMYRMFEVVIANFASEQLASISMVAPKSFNLAPDVRALSEKLGKPVHLIEVSSVTNGPAESAFLGLRYLEEETPIVIANSDQFLDFSPKDWIDSVLRSTSQGSILCMRDSDPKWSYARVGPDGLAQEVVEKQVISDLATCGVYFFRSSQIFKEGFRAIQAKDERVNGEFYVAPVYNELIKQGLEVSVFDLGPVSEVMFGLGIPADYLAFINSGMIGRTDSLCKELFRP
jgi:NDP-sugar pyrophosphorylase family protein